MAPKQTEKPPLSDHNLQRIKKMWEKSSADEKKLFRSLLAEMDDLTQLVHFFKGGHIMFQDDGNVHGVLSTMRTAKNRTRSSSHQSDSDQYSIQGSFMKEALAGTRTRNDKKYTWIQLEAHPVNSPSNLILHLLDYLIYKMTGKNIGPYGKSEHTEKKPLILEKIPKDKNTLKDKEYRSNFWIECLFTKPENVINIKQDELNGLKAREKSSAPLIASLQKMQQTDAAGRNLGASKDSAKPVVKK